jgi:hypothetical protein
MDFAARSGIRCAERVLEKEFGIEQETAPDGKTAPCIQAEVGLGEGPRVGHTARMW